MKLNKDVRLYAPSHLIRCKRKLEECGVQVIDVVTDKKERIDKRIIAHIGLFAADMAYEHKRGVIALVSKDSDYCYMLSRLSGRTYISKILIFTSDEGDTLNLCADKVFPIVIPNPKPNNRFPRNISNSNNYRFPRNISNSNRYLREKSIVPPSDINDNMHSNGQHMNSHFPQQFGNDSLACCESFDNGNDNKNFHENDDNKDFDENDDNKDFHENDDNKNLHQNDDNKSFHQNDDNKNFHQNDNSEGHYDHSMNDNHSPTKMLDVSLQSNNNNKKQLPHEDEKKSNDRSWSNLLRPHSKKTKDTNNDKNGESQSSKLIVHDKISACSSSHHVQHKVPPLWKKEAIQKVSFKIIKKTLVEFPAIWEHYSILSITKDILNNINEIYKKYNVRRPRDELSVRQCGWNIRCEMKMEAPGWTLNEIKFNSYPFVRVRVDLKDDSICDVKPICFKSYLLQEPTNYQATVSSYVKLTGKESRQTKKLRNEYIGDICDFNIKLTDDTSSITKYEVNSARNNYYGCVTYSLCASCHSNDKYGQHNEHSLTFLTWNITYSS